MIKGFQLYFNLTSGQVNDLYNYVTEDGVKALNFSHFKELIVFLDEAKQQEERRMIDIAVTVEQYSFLEKSINEAVAFHTIEDFTEWIRSKSSEEALQEQLSEAHINDLFRMISDFKANEKQCDVSELLAYINVIETTHDETDVYRKSSSTIESQSQKVIEAIKVRLSNYIEELSVIKKHDASENIHQIFQSFLKLTDETNIDVN